MGQCKVKVEVGKTVAIGNYENFKVSVGIEEFCDSEEVDVTFKRLKAWCKKRVSEETYETWL